MRLTSLVSRQRCVPRRTKVKGLRRLQFRCPHLEILEDRSAPGDTVLGGRLTGAFSSGDQFCFTGYNGAPNPNENVHPSIASIVSKQLDHRHSPLPAYVMISKIAPGTGRAYFGVAHKP